MKKSSLIVLAAVALFSGTMFAGLRYQVHKDDVLRERLGGVRVGMSKEDVRRLVGNPTSIIADPKFSTTRRLEKSGILK
jgi:outer membrane protein assembly factor BamE (lipoprotein component of BamABCDE complex)